MALEELRKLLWAGLAMEGRTEQERQPTGEGGIAQDAWYISIMEAGKYIKG